MLLFRGLAGDGQCSAPASTAIAVFCTLACCHKHEHHNARKGIN